MGTAAMSLRQGLAENLIGETVDLDVHLAGGNAVGRSANLEVHVAQMILVAQNIGKNGEFARLGIGDQSHGDTADRLADLHTGIHQRQTAGANRGHGRRTVRFQNIGNDTDRIGIGLARGQYLLEGAHGQVPVTDLATTRTAYRLHLARGERRKIIVQQEVVLAFDDGSVDRLFIQLGTERDRAQRLGLATGKNG